MILSKYGVNKMHDKLYKNKATNILILSILFCIYFIYVVGLILRVGIDSDYSNLVLEATDILNGNAFLADWNLTGISFATTDLVFFILGVIFSGTSITAYFFAVITMFIMLFAGAVLLSNTKEHPFSIYDFLIIVGVGGLPSIYGVNVIRAHTAVAAYMLFALYFLNKIRESNSNNKKQFIYYLFSIIFLSLGFAGDAISLIIGIIPVILINLYELSSNNNKNRNKKYYLILISIISLILGKIIDTVFISIGDTNKNDFLGQKFFGDLGSYADQFKVLVQSLLGIYNCDFTNQKLVSLTTLWFFIRVLLLFFVIYLIIKNISDLIKKKETDFISEVISLGLILMFILIITTDIMTNIYSARYIGYMPVFSSVLIIRYLKNKGFYNQKAFNGKISKKIIIAIVSVIVILSSIQTPAYSMPYQPQNSLALFLKEKGLTNGLGGFWDASHVTVASNNDVKVRAIIFNGEKHMAQFHWFCKNSWYSEPANFVVIDASGVDEFKISEESVRMCLGKPSQIMNFEEYVIYIYKDNLSDRIIKYVPEG